MFPQRSWKGDLGPWSTGLRAAMREVRAVSCSNVAHAASRHRNFLTLVCFCKRQSDRGSSSVTTATRCATKVYSAVPA